MPIIPGVPGAVPIPPGPDTLRNVCTNALYEINVIAPGEDPEASELAFVLSKFNQLVDSWNTRKSYVFAIQLQTFLLVPGLSPHTIGPPAVTGPNPTFQLAQNISRPVRIANGNIILQNVTPAVRSPLNIRDKDWWAHQRLQTIPANLPTDLYYRPDFPFGSLFFWPVPNFAYQVELELESILQGAGTLDVPFVFPPGYELAITLTLAELLCPAFEKTPNQILVEAALAAREAIKGPNAGPPRINLDDFGTGGGKKPLPSFNYRVGASTP